MRQVLVHLLPKLADPASWVGQAVVVIDVLRATTTVVAALARGAAEVVPCLEVDEARTIAQSRPGALLGGERRGERIAGFDLGNSPADYAAAELADRTIVFTTTNGTRALLLCREAEPVWLGAFSNLSAIVTAAAQQPAVHLLCAGTDGHVTREDVLFAGAVVDRLARLQPGIRCNDAAQLARDAWRYVELTNGQAAAEEAEDVQRQSDEAVDSAPPPPWLTPSLLASLGGQNLVALGMADDVAWAAEIDRYAVLPCLDPHRWSIRAV